MKRFIVAILAIIGLVACDVRKSSDDTQLEQQEKILQEGTNALGMPAITHFREKRLLKDILELRDQDGLITYTYTFSEQTGNYRWFCDSIGYGIPYATQYTNPLKENRRYDAAGAVTAQADPNGLFSPASAEGTWVMCIDPSGKDKQAKPVYIEPRVIVSPFKLGDRQ